MKRLEEHPTQNLVTVVVCARHHPADGFLVGALPLSRAPSPVQFCVTLGLKGETREKVFSGDFSHCVTIDKASNGNVTGDVISWVCRIAWFFPEVLAHSIRLPWRVSFLPLSVSFPEATSAPVLGAGGGSLTDTSPTNSL